MGLEGRGQNGHVAPNVYVPLLAGRHTHNWRKVKHRTYEWFDLVSLLRPMYERGGDGAEAVGSINRK